MEKMTEELLDQSARGMDAHRSVRLVPTLQEPNDGMGLFEASQGGKLKQATALARLLKKAGTSAGDAKGRIQKKHGLTDNELKSVLQAVWGKTEESFHEASFNPTVSKILNKGPKPDSAAVGKLAKRLGATVAKVSSGFELRWKKPDGSSEQPLYQVGANNVVWLMYQGKRTEPVGFAKDLMSVTVGKDEHKYPAFMGKLPKEDPWVMAARIDPSNAAIPKDARKHVEDVALEEGKVTTGKNLIAQALSHVDSESIRKWVTTGKNKEIWTQMANVAVKKGKTDPVAFAGYIMSVAMG